MKRFSGYPETGGRIPRRSADGASGYEDGTGGAARFSSLVSVGAYDGESVVVADLGNAALRRVWFAGAREGRVETLAELEAGGCASSATSSAADRVSGGLATEEDATVVGAPASSPPRATEATASGATDSEAAARVFDTGDLLAPLGALVAFGGTMGLVALYNTRRRKRGQGYRAIPAYHHRF